MESLKGPFKDIIPSFQKHKQSVGYKYHNINKFYQLDNFLYNKGIVDLSNTKKIFDTAITKVDNPNTKKNNFECLRNLYQFMTKVLGYKNLYFEKLHFTKQNNFIPYVLNEEEVNMFFTYVDKMCLEKNNKQKYLPVLFRLLYSSGLRINEAINLKLNDFDEVNGKILIRNSKNNITRLLPLSDSMFEVMKQYNKIINDSNRLYFFVEDDKKLQYYKIRIAFNKIKLAINIPNLRIHSFRHTMAIRTIEKMYNQKYELSFILYLLSIYMGHSNINSTLYYCKFTSVHYEKFFSIVNDKNNEIIPKVGDSNE